MQAKYLNAIKLKLSKIRIATHTRQFDENDDTLQRCLYFGKHEVNATPLEKMPTESNVEPVIINDDVQKLSEYSLMNTGARYELINANRMMLDIDISMHAGEYGKRNKEEESELYDTKSQLPSFEKPVDIFQQ